MTDDVRLSVSLRRHRKTKRLKRLLGADGCWALVCLFMWVGEERWTGDLSGLSDHDLEEEADWDGQPGSLVAALVEVGFMDGDEGSRKIHDWQEHNPYASGKGQRIEKSRNAANSRWHKHASSMPVACVEHAHEQCPPTPTPTPTPPLHEKKGQKQSRSRAPALPRPDSVDEQVWQDWLALRKAKKAPVTDTVMKTANREAEKAGLSLQAFLEIWCARGSQGLEASWIKPSEKEQFRGTSKPSPAERVAIDIARSSGEIPAGYEGNANVVAALGGNLRPSLDFSIRGDSRGERGPDLGEGIKWINAGASS